MNVQFTSGREVAGSDATMSLIQFCKDGDLERVKAALQRGEDVNTKGEYGSTGLIQAVSRKHNSVVALLLNTPNIDVNQKDNEGRCALHWAFTWENIEAVKLLLNAPNIDVNILDNNGASAVHLAVYKENVYDWDWTVHRDAQCTGHSIEGLKLLLSHPSLTSLTLNMKGRGHYGYTPVMWAVVWNRLKHVEVLVADPRVDLDTTDNEGKSLEEVARWLFCCILVGYSESYVYIHFGHHHHHYNMTIVISIFLQFCEISQES